MDISPQIPKDKHYIYGYGPEGFKINQIIYKNAVIISPEKLLKTDFDSLEKINLEILNHILDSNSEVLLIGTGKNHLFIDNNLKQQIKNSYPLLSINEMTSGSACRTYNILMSEDRNVVAVLMPL